MGPALADVRVLWGDGTWSSFFRGPTAYQANGHSWPSDPSCLQKKTLHPCSFTLSSHPLRPFSSSQSPTFWLRPHMPLGDTDAGCPASALCAHTGTCMHSVMYQDILQTYTLPNRLEVAHTSISMNEHVHSPPELCVPYMSALLRVPCTLGWSVWSEPASWHTQNYSEPASMLAVDTPLMQGKPALLLMCFSCLLHPRNLGSFCIYIRA